MTCNPKWEEIVSALKPDEIANDRPDLVTRIFVGKLQHLLDELLKKGIFGEVVVNIHVIEWQKKGLPHAHILFILHSDHKPRGPNEYDRMVSTELFNKDAHPILFEVVTSCMAPVAPSTHIALAWLTTFVQKATLRPSQSTPLTPPAPTQHTAAEVMDAHLSGKCANNRTMHLD
jgi:hypothetical protein